jgi:hypothetical protein
MNIKIIPKTKSFYENYDRIFDRPKCEQCGKPATHINEADPYEEEIHDRIVLCNLCEACWIDNIRDI